MDPAIIAAIISGGCIGQAINIAWKIWADQRPSARRTRAASADLAEVEVADHVVAQLRSENDVAWGTLRQQRAQWDADRSHFVAEIRDLRSTVAALRDTINLLERQIEQVEAELNAERRK